MYYQPLRTCAPTKWRPHESFNRNCSLCLQSDLSWTLNATLQRLLNANRRGRRRPEPSSPLRRHPPPTPAHPLQLRTISPTCHCPVLFVHCHRVIAVHQQDVHRDIRTSLIPTLVNLKIRRRMESKKQPTEPRRRRGATLQRSREPRRRRLPNPKCHRRDPVLGKAEAFRAFHHGRRLMAAHPRRFCWFLLPAVTCAAPVQATSAGMGERLLTFKIFLTRNSGDALAPVSVVVLLHCLWQTSGWLTYRNCCPS